MKNEKTKTSIKKPLCPFLVLDMFEADVTGKILRLTRPPPPVHARTHTVYSSLLIEEVLKKLLLGIMMKNDRRWRDEVMGSMGTSENK